MSGLSNYLAQALYDLTLVSGSVTALNPTGDVYVSIHTSDPNDGAVDTELAYSTYLRQKLGTTNFNGTTAVSTAEIVFPAPAGGDGMVAVTHWGIFNQSGLGTGALLYSGALASPRTLEVGKELVVVSGQLQIEFV